MSRQTAKNATAPELILGTEFMLMSADAKHRSPTNVRIGSKAAVPRYPQKVCIATDSGRFRRDSGR